jgi:hypothetical protein
MNGKTYYMILGVSRAESPGRIRAAYRDLAKKRHPDVAGHRLLSHGAARPAPRLISEPARRHVWHEFCLDKPTNGPALAS